MAVLNRDAAGFIDRANDPEKILLLVTSGGADWQPEAGLQVDAITSASRKSYIPDLVDLVSHWIQSDSVERWEQKDYVLALRYFPRVDVSAACSDIIFHQGIYKTKYPDLVRMINQAGYMFMRLDELELALQVFKMNLELFPNVWNVYDSYGEALLILGDLEGAKIQYQKAVKMNPDSKSSQNTLKKMGID